MKKHISLVKILKIFCAIGEVFGFIGLFALVALIPFSESMVDGHRANVGLYVVNGSPDWSIYTRQPNSTGGSFSYEGTTYALGGVPIPDSEMGAISLGPFRINLDENARRVISQDIKAQAVVIDHIEGTVTFKRPEKAAQVLASIKWPFVVTMLSTGCAGLAILDLLRRMFKSVERGEIFSAANIKKVRTIGFLLVASSIMKFVAVGWLVSRMGAYVAHHVAGTVNFGSASEGNLSGLGAGLVILALAEVFCQGLKLKEDSQLTI